MYTEGSAARNIEQNAIREAKARPAKLKIPYVRYALIAVCFFAALASIIYCNMQSTELAAQNSRLSKQLVSLADEKKALSAKIEQTYNLEYIENYATQRLGMVKQDKNSISYVELSNEERMTVAVPEEKTSEVLAGITRSFNIVLEYLN